MRDSISNALVKRAISPQSVADNTPLVSEIIDREGYEELEFEIATGSIADADATFTVLVEDGDASNLSDAAAVSDANLISQTPGTAPETAAAFNFGDDNEIRRIGYRGIKRYVRLTITPASNAAAALISATARLGRPAMLPVTQTAS